MPIALKNGLVYGPLRSRRLGQSLGVNVLPRGTKTCNYNCCYCQYGWTPLQTRGRLPAAWPEPEAVVAAVKMAFWTVGDIDRVTLAGNGEPTLYPRLRELARWLAELRDARAPHVRLAILSNGSTAGEPAVNDALRHFDDRYMKLDAGDALTLSAINAAPISIQQLVDGLRSIERVTLQAMFVRDADRHVDNTSPEHIDAWLDAVVRIRPLAVHVYSIDRPPAWRKLEVVPRAELDAIAKKVEEKGIPAVVF